MCNQTVLDAPPGPDVVDLHDIRVIDWGWVLGWSLSQHMEVRAQRRVWVDVSVKKNTDLLPMRPGIVNNFLLIWF